MQARDFITLVEEKAERLRRDYPVAAKVLDDLACHLLQLPEDNNLWRALDIEDVREAHEAALDEFEHQDWALPEDYLAAVRDLVLRGAGHSAEPELDLPDPIS